MSYLRNVILCETIVIDIHNRPTLVGIYSGDVIVSELPARLRLALYSEFMPDNVGVYNIQLNLAMDGKQFANMKIEADVAAANAPVHVISPPLEIGIDKELTFEVSASINEANATVILSKRIFKGPVNSATAWQQPSSQSLSAAPPTA